MNRLAVGRDRARLGQAWTERDPKTQNTRIMRGCRRCGLIYRVSVKNRHRNICFSCDYYLQGTMEDWT